MTYIRTEGKIIDITGKKTVGSYYGMKPNEICINCEYREADTIEELCDEFIIDANYKDTPYLYDRGEPVNSPEFDSKDEVVYGGIWTRGKHGKPILKPVAKLNEKGGWELL